MNLFIEKGIRGDIFHITKRHNKANNKYMQSYDDKKPSKFGVIKNGYGLVISQYLPYSKCKWLYQKEIDKFDVNLIVRWIHIRS